MHFSGSQVSHYMCSQNSKIVVSLASEMNDHTVISKRSDINFHNCVMKGELASLVLSPIFSSLGVKIGHLPFSEVRRYIIGFPAVFSCQPHSVALHVLAPFFVSIVVSR